MNTEKLIQFHSALQHARNELRAEGHIMYARVPEDTFVEITQKLFRAVETEQYVKDTEAFKRACKSLGIKNTYKAHNEFLERKGARE